MKPKNNVGVTLYFANPTFNNGLNVTVRRGVKLVGASDKILVKNINHQELGYAKAKYCKVKRFCDISNIDIENEHDEQCRNYEGLLLTMKKIYNDFDHHEIVTLIYFSMD